MLILADPITIIIVTPRAGVWIEIGHTRKPCRSYPVTPRAGVWIEIRYRRSVGTDPIGHSPCGSVD